MSSSLVVLLAGDRLRFDVVSLGNNRNGEEGGRAREGKREDGLIERGRMTDHQSIVMPKQNARYGVEREGTGQARLGPLGLNRHGSQASGA